MGDPLYPHTDIDRQTEYDLLRGRAQPFTKASISPSCAIKSFSRGRAEGLRCSRTYSRGLLSTPPPPHPRDVSRPQPHDLNFVARKMERKNPPPLIPLWEVQGLVMGK